MAESSLLFKKKNLNRVESHYSFWAKKWQEGKAAEPLAAEKLEVESKGIKTQLNLTAKKLTVQEGEVA